MKVVLRVILFIVGLGLLCGLAGALALITTVPWLSDFVSRLTGTYTWLPMVFAIVLLFFMAVSVLGLVLVVSVHPKKNLFVLNRDGGKIEITRQSVESEANKALEAVPELKRYHVHTRGDMRPGKLKLEVQAEPRDRQTDLARLGQTVQQHLSQVLAECLAIRPEHVKVRIQPVSTQETHHHHAKVPRVV